MIDRKLDYIIRELRNMALDLARLTASVQHVEEEDDAIIALCENMAAQLKATASSAADFATLQTQVNDFADRLAASSTKVAADVLANTASAPPPPAGP